MELNFYGIAPTRIYHANFSFALRAGLSLMSNGKIKVTDFMKLVK